MLIPICIFAKPPVPGEVKTRLIPALGAEGAAQLANAMMLDVWHKAESCAGVRPILATTRVHGCPMCVPDGDLWLQGDGDLGERIERIMTRGLLETPAVIAVGADSPALTVAHLEAAIELLVTNDAVVGPSTDGGFYLLGLRHCPRGLLGSLPWSTAETRQAMISRLREHAFSIAELEQLFDVDTPDDLHVLRAHLELAGPATRVWCKDNLPCG